MFSVIYKINDKIGLTASPGFACSPERALSTTGGLWNHVLNIGVMLVTERLYALAGKGVALLPLHRVIGGGHPPPIPTERSVRISRTTLFNR